LTKSESRERSASAAALPRSATAPAAPAAPAALPPLRAAATLIHSAGWRWSGGTSALEGKLRRGSKRAVHNTVYGIRSTSKITKLIATQLR
jgi:hypothetical protein